MARGAEIRRHRGSGVRCRVGTARRGTGTPPDVKLTRRVFDVSLCTRADGLWVTQKDIDMAGKISERACICTSLERG